jgi:exopolyphosphatase/guanosine-5'-triphosphate,3'-diphosphate pyrophosphatase
MRIASIDIGTNTLLLLVADIDTMGIIELVHHEERVPRLGREVDKKKVIGIAAFDKIGWILNEYKNLAVQNRCDAIVACATSAVRDAANRSDFISYLRSTTGINVEVLTGEEEAVWSYRGALNNIKGLHLPSAVIDIGGGSTEVSFPQDEPPDKSPLRHMSYQLGSVRLTERYFQHNPPAPVELDAAKKAIRSAWNVIEGLDGGRFDLVGAAGTVTTLACLDQNLPGFVLERVSGYRIPREHVEAWLEKLSKMTPEQIGSLSQATLGRSDILTAGVLILAEFMTRFHFKEVIATDRGLRYGMVIREWENMQTHQKTP